MDFSGQQIDVLNFYWFLTLEKFHKISIQSLSDIIW